MIETQIYLQMFFYNYKYNVFIINLKYVFHIYFKKNEGSDNPNPKNFYYFLKRKLV